jgi:hypothetical protein
VDGTGVVPRALRWAPAGLVVVVLAATAWWALAFQSVYREHPRIAASRLIYENAPDGSKITGEIWDDTIPYALPRPGADLLIVETFPYDTDSSRRCRSSSLETRRTRTRRLVSSGITSPSPLTASATP